MKSDRPSFVLVTANPHKLAEARRLVGAQLEGIGLDLPELQSLDLHQVLAAKAESAWQRLGRALVVEETGLELEALGGFPGPLVKWMLAAVGAEGIGRTAAALGETRVTARCGLFYRGPDRSLTAEGMTRGHLVLPPRGRQGFGWDPVFQPDGYELTYGELAGREKDAVSHRGRAWRELLAQLGWRRLGGN